jgi:hypothetical protein
MEQSHTQLYDDDTMMKKLIANKVPEHIVIELIPFFHLLVSYNSSQKSSQKTSKFFRFFHSHASDNSSQKTPTWLIESINNICDIDIKGKITGPIDNSAICGSLVLSGVPCKISHEISVLVERVIFGNDEFRIPFSALRSTLDKFI